MELKALNYFSKKTSSWMLDTVLSTILIAGEIIKLRHQFSKKLIIMIRMMKNEENGYFYPFSDQKQSNPTNVPCRFHVETTWKRPFPRRFNVEFTYMFASKWENTLQRRIQDLVTYLYLAKIVLCEKIINV